MAALFKERALFFGVLAIALLMPFEHALLKGGTVAIGAAFAAIFAVILAAAMAVARHAEALAHKYGEPYGTLILTGSAVAVEVIMLVILMQGGGAPTLVRDTIYAALMLDINGIIGLAAIIGGLRHGEQRYNVDSSNSYIAMILVAVGVGMVVPDFIGPDVWQIYSLFNIVIMIIMYGVFTRLQTMEHRYFFNYDYPVSADEDRHDPRRISGKYHGLLLCLLILLIGVLAEMLSAFLNEGIAETGLPVALAGVLVALISASPEILTAVRAALENRMQTVINIALGASLATVLMTIPVVEITALVMQMPLVMGLSALQAIMIGLTMWTAMVNLNNGETNALEGMVHLVLFLTFVILIFLIPGAT